MSPESTPGKPESTPFSLPQNRPKESNDSESGLGIGPTLLPSKSENVQSRGGASPEKEDSFRNRFRPHFSKESDSPESTPSPEFSLSESNFLLHNKTRKICVLYAIFGRFTKHFQLKAPKFYFDLLQSAFLCRFLDVLGQFFRRQMNRTIPTRNRLRAVGSRFFLSPNKNVKRIDSSPSPDSDSPQP